MTGLDRRYTVPLVASPRQPARLYTAAAAGPPPSWRQGANAALYRSDDGGEHWVRLEQGLPQQFDAMVRQIAVDDAGTVVLPLAMNCSSARTRVIVGNGWQQSCPRSRHWSQCEHCAIPVFPPEATCPLIPLCEGG